MIIGCSTAFGQWVPEEKTFAALVPKAIAKETGRQVEVYNEGMIGARPQVAVLHFSEVLSAKPDMILWVITRWKLTY